MALRDCWWREGDEEAKRSIHRPKKLPTKPPPDKEGGMRPRASRRVCLANHERVFHFEVFEETTAHSHHPCFHRYYLSILIHHAAHSLETSSPMRLRCTEHSPMRMWLVCPLALLRGARATCVLPLVLGNSRRIALTQERQLWYRARSPVATGSCTSIYTGGALC